MITLATLPQATEQEVFDQISHHLITQGEASVGEDDICKYRGLDGLKCAAGCIIGDTEYKKSFENNSWYDLADKGLVPHNHKSLISDLQNVHDSFKVEEWRECLCSLALQHHLSVPDFLRPIDYPKVGIG